MTATISAGQTPATSGAGDQTPPAQMNTAGQAPAAQPSGATPDGKTTEQGQQGPTGFDAWPEDAQSYLRNLRKENENLRKKNITEKQQAEEQRLAEQQKWQELAEQRKGQLEAMTPYKERYEQLAAAQRARILSEVEKWPAEVKKVMPGADSEVSSLAEWVENMRPVVQQLQQVAAPAAPGHGLPPKPAGQGQRDEAQRKQQSVVAVRNRF